MHHWRGWKSGQRSCADWRPTDFGQGGAARGNVIRFDSLFFSCQRCWSRFAGAGTPINALAIRLATAELATLTKR